MQTCRSVLIVRPTFRHARTIRVERDADELSRQAALGPAQSSSRPPRPEVGC